MREHGKRRGFRAVTFDGWTRIIATVDHPGPVRVGRYGVDVAAIDALVERSLATPAVVYLIDEVGKMECYSALPVSRQQPVITRCATGATMSRPAAAGERKRVGWLVS